MPTSKSKPKCNFLNSLFGGPPLNEYFEECIEKGTSKTSNDLKNYESARKQKKHKNCKDHVPVMLCPKNLNEVVDKLFTVKDSKEKSLDILLSAIPEPADDGVPMKGMKNMYIKGRVYYGKPNRRSGTPLTGTSQAVRLEGPDVFLEHRTPHLEEVAWEAVARVYNRETGAGVTNTFASGEPFDIGTLPLHPQPANPNLAVNIMTQGNYHHLGEEREFKEDAETQTALDSDGDLLTTITITRSRTHFIKYSDGIEVTEKVGTENFVYGKPLTNTGNPTSPLVKIYRPLQDVKRDSCQKVGNDKYIYPSRKSKRHYVDKRPSIECENCVCESEEGINLEKTTAIVSDPNFGEILPNGYNPLTWLYKSYSKTKAFIKEFSVTN